jgi:hypothetical protein
VVPKETPPKIDDGDEDGAKRTEHFRHMQGMSRDGGALNATEKTQCTPTYNKAVDVQVNTDVLLLLHSTLATAAL